MQDADLKGDTRDGVGSGAIARGRQHPGRVAPHRKERLGGKASDEQRVDNCKVPPDKRGTKPRADTCPPDLTH